MVFYIANYLTCHCRLTGSLLTVPHEIKTSIHDKIKGARQSRELYVVMKTPVKNDVVGIRYVQGSDNGDGRKQ